MLTSVYTQNLVWALLEPQENEAANLGKGLHEATPPPPLQKKQRIPATCEPLPQLLGKILEEEPLGAADCQGGCAGVGSLKLCTALSLPLSHGSKDTKYDLYGASIVARVDYGFGIVSHLRTWNFDVRAETVCVASPKPRQLAFQQKHLTKVEVPVGCRTLRGAIPKCPYFSLLSPRRLTSENDLRPLPNLGSRTFQTPGASVRNFTSPNSQHPHPKLGCGESGSWLLHSMNNATNTRNMSQECCSTRRPVARSTLFSKVQGFPSLEAPL